MIDDFAFFEGVTATAPGDPSATATSSTNVIQGGARDLTVTITQAVLATPPGDGTDGDASIIHSLSPANGALMTIGRPMAALFGFVYDGAGVGAAAAGLGLDLASYGDALSFRVTQNAVLTGGVFGPAGFTFTLTDAAGRTAAVTQTPLDMTPVTLSFGFGAFEAANSLLDLRAIDRIALTSLQRHETGFVQSQVRIGAISVVGDAYTPTNVIPAPGVPEPASWAMLILGFGAAGAAIRRSRAAPGPAARRA